MSRFNVSTWLSSSGGPLIVMDASIAGLWTGVDGQPSDYAMACQSADYAGKLAAYGTEVLILGDEPLQTAVASAGDTLLIVRWKWAESEAEVRAQIEHIDLGRVSFIEQLSIDWLDSTLVMFDAADRFNPQACLKFQVDSPMCEVSTFLYEPTPQTALLIHSLTPRPVD
ncbi:Imm21 family immunity protein [Pseudomonas purpurea]|uniref:Imm21 family immunity protein n=1 Tax=Pseudomonas purpurea TaxID=3136737 RepID=UPI003264E2C3